MKKILFIGILMLTSFSINAQVKAKKGSNHFWENVRFGGGLGLSIGDGFFSGSLLPSAIYDVNNFYSVGVGLNFTYASSNNFDTFVYGGSVINIFRPTQGLQLSAEFEELRVDRAYNANGISYQEDYWYPALFLGLGYDTGNVTVGVRYDVLYDEEKSIYGTPLMPFVRVYF
ncbi:alpha-ketoglutarate decarboxylase [Mesonia sp. K7]|uniref:alpha-ketoglutarate decarboxylase n=1 Tax=Mesonia sp. K7 TaxID=2218606 RepID=UPI000DA930AE|nr:alpha-ketoglutarate decarboxylase [Mesonia sp. K7]PZD78304.1 alpha-ketoglutarate decarboxylase [Mesonia sp. K7]